MDLEWYEILAELAEESRKVFIWGPPGTGKTTRCLELLGEDEEDLAEAYNLTITEETTEAEVKGHWIPKGDEFEWHDGPVIKAAREGKPIVLNEIDRATGGIETFLHNALDDAGVVRFDLPNGETVVPEDGFRIWATSNQSPKTIPEALLDRFPVRLEADVPVPEALDELPDDVRAVIENSYESRSHGSSVSDSFVSLREGFAYTEIRDTADEDIALEAVFPERKAAINEALAVVE